MIDFTKSYKDGGLTTRQILILYDELQIRKMHDFEFLANIHGVDTSDTPDANVTKETKKDLPKFGDPKDYEHMTQEQREKLTVDMRGQYVKWVADMGKK